jgi:hypothetical protein
MHISQNIGNYYKKIASILSTSSYKKELKHDIKLEIYSICDLDAHCFL